MNRYFELIDNSANHYKFWWIVIDNKVVNVTYGRIGTAGQTQVKTFNTVGAALGHFHRLIGEKTRKGYVEKPAPGSTQVHQPLPKVAPVQAPVSPKPVKAPVAPPVMARPNRMKVGRLRRREDEK